jgi:hypothetical protein
VAKEMGLNEEQKMKVRSVNRELVDMVRALPPPARDTAARQQRGEMESKIRKGIRDKVMATLTPQQKAKWKELTGEPFDVEPHIFGRGARPQGQPQKEPKKTGS